MSKELQELFDNARYLKNWTPKLHGKEFIVEGDLIDFTSQGGDGCNSYFCFPDRWKTSKIKRRHLANLVATSGSVYVLEGAMNIPLAEFEAIPQFVVDAFARCCRLLM